MRGETLELWQQLSQQAAVEQDPDKLLQLTKEITRLLDEKEQRLTNRANSASQQELISTRLGRAQSSARIAKHCYPQQIGNAWTVKKRSALGVMGDSFCWARPHQVNTKGVLINE